LLSMYLLFLGSFIHCKLLLYHYVSIYLSFNCTLWFLVLILKQYTGWKYAIEI